MGDRDPRHARFVAVVLPHLDTLLAFARRRTAAEADAEDAVQDACVRAWCALDQLRDDAHARPWLFQILRRVLGRSHEKLVRRDLLADTVSLHDADIARLVADGPDALDALIAEAATQDVERALALLPELYAVAVELRDVEGLSCREVAAALDVPVGTALSRVHRGRRLLARILAREHDANAAHAATHRVDRGAPLRVPAPFTPSEHDRSR